MNKTIFKEICTELKEKFSDISYETGDLSDVGNEIGIIVAKYFDLEDFGNKEEFMHGLKHGISLTDGTHF
jgi:hypothetical protein